MCERDVSANDADKTWRDRKYLFRQITNYVPRQPWVLRDKTNNNNISEKTVRTKLYFGVQAAQHALAHQIISFDFAYAINWISTSITFESAHFRQTWFFSFFRLSFVHSLGVSTSIKWGFHPSTAFSLNFFFSILFTVFSSFSTLIANVKKEFEKKERETNGYAHENVPASKRITQFTQPAQNSFSRTCLNDGLFAWSILFSVCASISYSFIRVSVGVRVKERAPRLLKNRRCTLFECWWSLFEPEQERIRCGHNLNTRFKRIYSRAVPFQHRIRACKF